MLLTYKYLSMKKIKILGVVRTILNVLLFVFISLYVLTLFITPVYYVDGKRTVSSWTLTINGGDLQFNLLNIELSVIIVIAILLLAVFLCIRRVKLMTASRLICTIDALKIELGKTKKQLLTTASNRLITNDLSVSDLTDNCYLKPHLYRRLKSDIGDCYSSVFYIISQLSVQPLTEDDYLYTALMSLGYKNETIKTITRWSGSAIKSRLYHIKQKMTVELFETLLNS